jgi:hypothetical protein
MLFKYIFSTDQWNIISAYILVSTCKQRERQRFGAKFYTFLCGILEQELGIYCKFVTRTSWNWFVDMEPVFLTGKLVCDRGCGGEFAISMEKHGNDLNHCSSSRYIKEYFKN